MRCAERASRPGRAGWLTWRKVQPAMAPSSCSALRVAHHHFSSNGSFQVSTRSDRAARLHRWHEKITAQVREASVTGSPRAAARFDSVMPGQLRRVALSERAAACKSSTFYYVKVHEFHLKMGLWVFRPAFA